MSALASPVSVAESFGEFRSNGLVLDGPASRLERIYDYERGKLHPVHLGDVLGDRYKVLDKLGSGSYGTVWLCRDTRSELEEYVAVKIIMADASIHDCPELRVNKLVELGIDKGDLAERFGVTLDNFDLRGPNGRHFCLVYPVLGPPVSKLFHMWPLEDPGKILRKVCFEVTEAMAALHSYGICHGDFRPENILSRVAGLNGLSERSVREALGEPNTTKVLMPTASGVGAPHSKPTAPQYLVKPLRWYIAESDEEHETGEDEKHGHVHLHKHERPSSRFVTPSACIIDFHESFMVTNLPEDLGIPQQYCAPEYIFDKEIGYGTDLWALGCTLFEIRTGRVMFRMAGDDLDDYLVSVVDMLGKLPEPWWSTSWEERKDYFEDIVDRKGKAIKVMHALSLDERAGMKPRASSIQDAIGDGLVCDDGEGWSHDHRTIPNEEIILFADLLKKLLRYSPEERMTAEDALEHPWFSM